MGIKLCDFHGPIGRCIYIDGHGGEHFQDDGRRDYSDECRLRILRDECARLDAKVADARAAGKEREA